MIAAETFFLDVGQGTAQVVLLPNGGAIVIDCGTAQSAHVLLRLLRTYLHGNIEVLALSHNDRDHDGGAVRLLTEFAEQVRKIAYVADRCPESMRVFPLVAKLRRERRFTGVEMRLEHGDDYPPLYVSPDGGMTISVLWPDFRAACGAASPNAASSIISLQCGERRIVFSGDAPLPAWKGLSARLGGRLACDVLAIPHHGASLGDDRWVYDNAVKTTYGVISVGSCNQYDHPCASTIRAAVAAGVQVVCTEITERCCDDLGNAGNVTAPIAPSLCMDGAEHNRACAGTVLAEISAEAVTIKPFARQRAAIKRLAACGTAKPLCL